MRTLNILGSTGSIGTQALQVVALHPDRFQVRALTANRNKELLFEQVRTFRPEVAGLVTPIDPREIPDDLRFCRWVMGAEALHAAAAETPADMVLVAVVGIAGLQSVMDALAAGRQVLLANKEALVTGGHLVMDAARAAGKPLLDWLRFCQTCVAIQFFSLCSCASFYRFSFLLWLLIPNKHLTAHLPSFLKLFPSICF